MSRRKWISYGCVLFILLMLVGCGNTTAQIGEDNISAEKKVKLFDTITDIEDFQGVPVMTVANGKVEVQGDIGAGNQVAIVNGSEADEYWSYLDVLQDKGFEKYVDNGEEGLYGDVLSAALTKGELTLTVIHMVKANLTYIVAEDNIPLSDHLFYQDEYVSNNIEGAETTLHMMELNAAGNCFIIQLKNGHFIVDDGGREADLPYLLEYLEKLAPEGEKPVIEAWLITHLHSDHAGAFEAFSANSTYLDRIYVQGIYTDLYNSDVSTRMNTTGRQLAVRTVAQKLQTTEGGHPEIYRPHAGQTYYFNDIKIDILQTMIQCPEDSWYRYSSNLNEFSTCRIFQIEGQKYLNVGDADYGAMRAMMRTYDSEDFEVDIMAVSHHGINVYNDFSDFVSAKTLLYTNFGIYGTFETGHTWAGSWQASEDRNEYLQAKALESYSYGDGTVTLSFPYAVGTAKNLGQSRTDREPITDENRIKYY